MLCFVSNFGLLIVWVVGVLVAGCGFWSGVVLDLLMWGFVWLCALCRRLGGLGRGLWGACGAVVLGLAGIRVGSFVWGPVWGYWQGLYGWVSGCVMGVECGLGVGAFGVRSVAVCGGALGGRRMQVRMLPCSCICVMPLCDPFLCGVFFVSFCVKGDCVGFVWIVDLTRWEALGWPLRSRCRFGAYLSVPDLLLLLAVRMDLKWVILNSRCLWCWGWIWLGRLSTCLRSWWCGWGCCAGGRAGAI